MYDWQLRILNMVTRNNIVFRNIY